MNTTTKKPFRISGLMCLTLGHDYMVTRQVSEHIKEYKCSHCGKEVAENDLGQIEELTMNIKRANNSLVSFLEKKKKKRFHAA